MNADCASTVDKTAVMPRAVLLAGGWAHPPSDMIVAMQSLLGERGFDVAVAIDPAEAVVTLAGNCDLLVVGCCWFAMQDSRYTPDQRRENAVPFDGELRDAITKVLADGCPVMALHTAVISFDAADAWNNLIGGSWNWATSWHPEPTRMAVRPAAQTPIDFAEFSVVDELYQGLDMQTTAIVVAESEGGDPLVWLHAEAGRAAVNLLGHDQRSLAEPAHRALNERLLDWLVAPHA